MNKDEWNATYRDGIDEGWFNLQIAVVKQAVKDYCEWQKREERLIEKLKSIPSSSLFYDDMELEAKKLRGKINELERWFLSEWGQALSCGKGELIIETFGKKAL